MAKEEPQVEEQATEAKSRAFRLKSPELKFMDEIDAILTELENDYGCGAVERTMNWINSKWLRPEPPADQA